MAGQSSTATAPSCPDCGIELTRVNDRRRKVWYWWCWKCDSAKRMSVPRHQYDRAYAAIPDAPQGSMLDVARLPVEVRSALRVCRDYEAQGAVWPALLSNEARAWFRWFDRASGLGDDR